MWTTLYIATDLVIIIETVYMRRMNCLWNKKGFFPEQLSLLSNDEAIPAVGLLPSRQF